MARTRKSISSLNLHTYDVLIEDRGPRSDYFRISQFDGYFYGGRNAFLIAGSSVLRPGTTVLLEILNKNNTIVYSAPVPSFIEGSSRLIQVEVYGDTPIGPGKIIVLGCTDYFLDGTPVPEEWRGKYNVRWITDVTISPLVQSRAPIRFPVTPTMTVTEKFYPSPASSSFSESISLPIDVSISSKYYNVFSNGYSLELNAEDDQVYTADYLNGIITGSVQFENGSVSETASIRLPITRIFNNKNAESVGSLIYTDISNTLITSMFLSSSGQYATSIQPIGNINVTSSVNLLYNKLTAAETGSEYSYANIRIVDTETISGEVHQIRISYKPTTDPGDYVVLANIPVKVQELLSVDSSSKILETGKFTNIDTPSYWYAATMSVAKNEIIPTVPEYYSSSSIPTNLTIIQSSNDLLDAIYVNNPIAGNTYEASSYFIGTTISASLLLFPRTEYTLSFDALVSNASGSILLEQPNYSIEVYLVNQENSSNSLLTDNPLGQFIGTVVPKAGFQKQNFDRIELNFVPQIVQSGQFALRFVVYGGFWNIANVSLKPSEEPLFSPDEINVLIPIINYSNSILSFKSEFLDVDNNSAGITIESTPVFFTGSSTYIRRDALNNIVSAGVATVPFMMNGGNAPLTTGFKGTIRIPTDSILSNVRLYTSGSGSIDVDLLLQSYGTYDPSPTAGISIVGTPISIVDGTKYQDTTLSGWIKNLSKDDIINVVVTGVSGLDLKLATLVFDLETVLESIPTFSSGPNIYLLEQEILTPGVASVSFVISGGGGEITPGYKGTIRVPTNATLSKVGMYTSGSGSIHADLIRQDFSTYDPSLTTGMSIVGTPLSMSNNTRYLDNELIGWTTSLYANDILNVVVNETSGVDLKIATIVLNLED